jgi:hypothetical protein
VICIRRDLNNGFVFRRNFTRYWEAQGASFAAYVNGVKVVELWGGWADKSCHRVWTEETISCSFSTTKVCLDKICYDNDRFRALRLFVLQCWSIEIWSVMMIWW